MKQRSHIYLASAVIGFFALGHASASVLAETTTYNPNLVIPDGSTLGVADTQTIASQIAVISEVRVSMSILGEPGSGDAFNGDFYAYLTHGSGFAVLLNRVGRTMSDDFGYDDSGFNVVFDDSPSGNDIHLYQLTTNTGGAGLTGTWGSDGRNVNPGAALDTTPRTAFLDSFTGLDPNGDWTLFVADVSPLGTARLASWQLEVTGGSIPEPSSVFLAIFGGAALVGCSRCRIPTKIMCESENRC